MKLKDLINDLSQDSGVPAGQVRKVAKALTHKLKALLDQHDGFRSGDLVFKPVTLTAKPASEGKEATPERKIARLMVRPLKPKGARDEPSGDSQEQ